MALTKEVVFDQTTVDSVGFVFVREVTIVSEDGIELTRSYHRTSLYPGQDVTAMPESVQSICAAVWTPEVIAAYQAKVAAEQSA